MTRDPLNYLALGDSYTIGEGVSSNLRWPSQLARALRLRGVSVLEPRIIARTGWTTEELAAEIESGRSLSHYQLVSLLVGVNDQYRGRSLEDYRGGFARVLHHAVRLAGEAPGRLFVLSIPDWSVTPFAADRDTGRIETEIEAFNAVALEESRVAGASFVDITEISRRASHDPGLLAGDGLHPSGAMYSLWVDACLPTVLRVLSRASIA